MKKKAYICSCLIILASISSYAHAQNDAITPLLAGHADPRVGALTAQLLQESPQFFALGGNKGRIYLIRDPEGRVPPFVLSDEAGRRNRYDAPDLCPAGSTLPDRAQLEALGRAMTRNGRYDRNAIPGIPGTYV